MAGAEAEAIDDAGREVHVRLILDLATRVQQLDRGVADAEATNRCATLTIVV